MMIMMIMMMIMMIVMFRLPPLLHGWHPGG